MDGMMVAAGISLEAFVQLEEDLHHHTEDNRLTPYYAVRAVVDVTVVHRTHVALDHQEVHQEVRQVVRHEVPTNLEGVGMTAVEQSHRTAQGDMRTGDPAVYPRTVERGMAGRPEGAGRAGMRDRRGWMMKYSHPVDDCQAACQSWSMTTGDWSRAVDRRLEQWDSRGV